MVFARYFLRRFVIYFFTLTFLLSLLFNLIEFFEKLVRVSHANLTSILYFIGLNFLPSFSELMPIGAWLAACLMLREFYQQNEWEGILILNIGHKEILKLFCVAGLIVMGFGLFVNETLILPFSVRATQFKEEVFKKAQKGKVFDTWYHVNKYIFCHIGMLDFATKKGIDILMVHLSKDFKVTKIVTGKEFAVKLEEHEIIITSGQSFFSENQSYYEIRNKVLNMPDLFLQMKLHHHVPSLVRLTGYLIDNNTSVASPVKKEIIWTILNRFLFYFQLLLYPLLVALLFILFEYCSPFNWLAILLPYPIVTFLMLLASLSSNGIFSVAILAIPYVLFPSIIGGFFWYNKLRSKSS